MRYSNEDRNAREETPEPTNSLRVPPNIKSSYRLFKQSTQEERRREQNRVLKHELAEREHVEIFGST